jgi:hypothetical protein
MIPGFRVSDVEMVKELFLSRINYYEDYKHAYARAEEYKALLVKIVDLLEGRREYETRTR